MANRLRVILSEVVFETQSVFNLGRLILDNAIIGFECMYTMHTIKRKKGSMIVKLDMSKAYNKVEWGFLTEVMLRLGLPRWWVERVIVSGKEVLIKDVLQSIPAYSMGLFKMPVGLLKEIQRLCNRFWWGSTEEKQ
ncbi:hypothetical protein Ddye_021029 [Dipteronia dyeriana]|uniref:Reverse transcriptase n=1 Tax=Dipteronia dyeriana TaxID=168575 RepID=A0AAD9U0U8_9ROSI|nr:hypothetical protein Ddye_021029 [Dipteronia dyeriana]